MSVSYPLSPSNGVSLASQLPVEIQFVVLKEVVMNHLNYKRGSGLVFGFYQTHHDMLAQLVSMLGYSADFDMVLSMVIQELDFDSTIFVSLHFKRFARFIITKSLQIKSMKVFPSFHDATLFNEPDIIRFLEFHCQTVVSFSTIGIWPFSSERMLKHSYYLKFTHCLNWRHDMFSLLYHCGLLSQLRRLTKLVIHLKDQGNITVLNRIIKASWFKASTKLVLKFEPGKDSDAVDCLSRLNGILQENERLNISMDISLINSNATFQIE
ncbi:unnamed protein product [Ambrosiozyma monospora]|uniref:Unnamed protein product n=1 Tax=Ambrosiozyma monospora TaxID=43982 RepID=A0ACB5U454_AMBMO|nr:unnamed protein product [Ambrosiozyma monospora]